MIDRDLSVFIGAAIQGVELSEGDTRMWVFTDRGRYTLTAEGDCCSESWFEHVDLPPPVLGRPVLKVSAADKDGSHVESDTSHPEYLQDEHEISFATLATDRGAFTFELRNSSNGYYGGYLTVTGPVETGPRP
jgi:hypothetical protein